MMFFQALARLWRRLFPKRRAARVPQPVPGSDEAIEEWDEAGDRYP